MNKEFNPDLFARIAAAVIIKNAKKRAELRRLSRERPPEELNQSISEDSESSDPCHLSSDERSFSDRTAQAIS